MYAFSFFVKHFLRRAVKARLWTDFYRCAAKAILVLPVILTVHFKLWHSLPLCMLILLCVPLQVYWRAVFECLRFGFKCSFTLLSGIVSFTFFFSLCFCKVLELNYLLFPIGSQHWGLVWHLVGIVVAIVFFHHFLLNSKAEANMSGLTAIIAAVTYTKSAE